MKTAIWFDIFNSPLLGWAGLAVSSQGVVRVDLRLEDEQQFKQRLLVDWDSESELVKDQSVTAPLVQQLRDYEEGKLREFKVAVDWRGVTSFQQAVLQATREIPFGETRTYGEIARIIGKPGAARAVGQAEAANPVPLIIPCHRVIGSDGSMRGYGGPEGVDFKARLLEFES